MKSKYLRNIDEITGHGNQSLRKTAAEIIEHGLITSDPYEATKRLVHLDGSKLSVEEIDFDLNDYERIFVFGTGKATFPIAKALEEILADRITDGLVVLKKGTEANLKYIQVIYGAHPVPDEDGHRGAKRMYEMAGECTARDLVLTCITGGSSALLPLPVDTVSLEDKQKVNQILLFSGADITQINAVRKHLSQIKGGWLAKRILPATIINLTVSDVIGDPLDYITDPTVPDTSTFDDARRVMDQYDLWDKFPESASNYIKSGKPDQETPKEFKGQPLYSFIIVEGASACHGAARKATELGFEPMILTTMLKGEAKDAGSIMASIGLEIALNNRPLRKPCAIIAGGENTVTIQGDYGTGGPNQEFALAAALDIHGYHNIVVASIDTDGTDGPTNLAGGIVDGNTVEAAINKNLDIPQALRFHDVSHTLMQLGDAVITGQTGTNVNDLKLVLIS